MSFTNIDRADGPDQLYHDYHFQHQFRASRTHHNFSPKPAKQSAAVAANEHKNTKYKAMTVDSVFDWRAQFKYAVLSTCGTHCMNCMKAKAIAVSNCYASNTIMMFAEYRFGSICDPSPLGACIFACTAPPKVFAQKRASIGTASPQMMLAILCHGLR